MKTVLKDRELWFDGDSVVNERQLFQLLSTIDSTKTFVKEITPEIKKYNQFCDPDDRLQVKQTLKPLTFDWKIPAEYKTLNIGEYVAIKFLEKISNAGLSHIEVKVRTDRIVEELNLYENLKLQDILRTLIFVIDTFKEKNIVWGVGRGSSVSSYILYILGVHDVDSVLYDLNINEFLRV